MIITDKYSKLYGFLFAFQFSENADYVLIVFFSMSLSLIMMVVLH